MYRNVAKQTGISLETTQSIPDMLTTVAEVCYFFKCISCVIAFASWLKMYVERFVVRDNNVMFYGWMGIIDVKLSLRQYPAIHTNYGTI